MSTEKASTQPKGEIARRIKERTSEIHQFQMRSERIRNTDSKDWTDGGHGWMADIKPSGCTWVILKNMNSIKYWTEGNQRRIL